MPVTLPTNNRACKLTLVLIYWPDSIFLENNSTFSFLSDSCNILCTHPPTHSQTHSLSKKKKKFVKLFSKSRECSFGVGGSSYSVVAVKNDRLFYFHKLVKSIEPGWKSHFYLYSVNKSVGTSGVSQTVRLFFLQVDNRPKYYGRE